VKDKSRYADTHSHVFLISNSNHHMQFDNPEHLVQCMLDDLSNINELDKAALSNNEEDVVEKDSTVR